MTAKRYYFSLVAICATLLISSIVFSDNIAIGLKHLEHNADELEWTVHSDVQGGWMVFNKKKGYLCFVSLNRTGNSCTNQPY
jgi:hypothetical protein